MRFWIVTFLCLCVSGLVWADHKPTDAAVTSHLLEVSVTIVSKSDLGSGEGSGEIVTRKTQDGDVVNFVWTAAHVVTNLRRTRQVIDSRTGGTKTVVEFDDATVVKALNEDGRMVGKIEFLAEVIRFSAEEDLALLRLHKKNFITDSVKFYLDRDAKGKPVIPAVGTHLWHVGSLLGQVGSNSFTDGVLSQHGRLVEKKVFDQSTVNAFPGSSGGGVYLEDGRMIGMVVRGAGETFNLIVPVRRIHDWAKHAKVEWAIDEKVPMPTVDEMKKMPVEDNGVEFSHSRKTEGDQKGLWLNRVFGSGQPHLGKRESEFPTWHIFRPAK